MRRNIFFIAIVCIAMFFNSCYSDDTSIGTIEISEITIDLGEYNQEDVINIDKHEVLVIDPEIKQLNENLELTYEWEIGYELYSSDKVLNYVGEELGTFQVRLKVTNKDGSEFKTFKIRVNSPYEEGLFILSEDDVENGSLGFIRRYDGKTIGETPLEDVGPDVFTINNNGKELGKGVTDIVKRNVQLFISSTDEGSIKVVNAQTLEMEGEVTAPDLPDFKPYRLNIPDDQSTSAMVLSANGKVFTFATNEFVVLERALFGPDVDLELKTQFVADMNFTMNYFWDNNASQLWNIWYIDSNSKDEFVGHELVQFFAANYRTYVLTKIKGTGTYVKTVFGAFIQEYFDDPLDIIEQNYFEDPNTVLTKDAVTLVDEDYYKLVYAVDNKIYHWFYSGTNISEPAYITIDIPGVITSLEKNEESNELFVGVYDVNASGRKGSVLVYNIDSGNKLASFEGVSDKPVRLLYKNKSQE